MIDPAFFAKLRAISARALVGTRQALDHQILLGQLAPDDRAEAVAAVNAELMRRAAVLDKILAAATASPGCSVCGLDMYGPDCHHFPFMAYPVVGADGSELTVVARPIART